MEDIVAEERDARSAFRALLAAFAETHPDLETRVAAKQFGMSLMSESPELVSEFLAIEAENILTLEMRAQFSRTRKGIFAAIGFSNPDRPEPPALADLPDKKKEALYEKITQWREFVPSENRARLMLTFTKPQLLESAQYDAGLAFQHGWKQLLKQRLAEGLPNDTTTVAEFYTPEQLAIMGETIRKEMSRGHFRLKLQPVRTVPGQTAIQEQTDGRHSKRSETDRRMVAGEGWTDQRNQ